MSRELNVESHEYRISRLDTPYIDRIRCIKLQLRSVIYYTPYLPIYHTSLIPSKDAEHLRPRYIPLYIVIYSVPTQHLPPRSSVLNSVGKST